MFDKTRNKISKECFQVVLCLLVGAVLLPQFIDLVLLPEEDKVSETYSLFFKLMMIQVLITTPIALLIYPKHRSIPNLIFCVGLPQLISIYIFGDSLLTSLVCTFALVCVYLATYFFPAFWERIRKKDPLEKLSFEQRFAVLRYVFKRELKHLGVRLPVQLIPSRRLLSGTLACYCPATGVVEINKWLLMIDRPKGAELCAICAHEAQHVAQVDALISINYDEYLAMTPEERLAAKQISQEFVHYKSASKDGFDAYRKQAIERQARAYEDARKKYYRKHLPAMVAAYLKHQEEKRGSCEREQCAHNSVASKKANYSLYFADSG